MPYISVTTSKKFTEAEATTLKAELGRLVTIIPGKTENGLMIAISHDTTMFMRGEKAEAAFVDVRLFHEAPLEAKQSFTAEVFTMLADKFGFDISNMYLAFGEYQNWGLRGSLS